MAIVKKTNSNYVIQTNRDVSANITLDTDEVYVKGNLTVSGATTSFTTNNTNITDNIIVLNDGESGSGVTKGTAGIAIDRGNYANVELRWLEGANVWQVTADGSTYSNILLAGGGGALTAVVDDPAPVLGGNLNVDGRAIYANTNVIFGSNVQMNIPSTLPSSPVDSTTIFYADTPGGGTTGLYVLNSGVSNQELITKTRAFGFSLIL